MAENEKLNIDSVINRLLEGLYGIIYRDLILGEKFELLTASIALCDYLVRGSRPGKNVQLTEAEIRGLCLKSREIFLSQPILLELEAPLKICGRSKIMQRSMAGI